MVFCLKGRRRGESVEREDDEMGMEEVGDRRRRRRRREQESQDRFGKFSFCRVPERKRATQKRHRGDTAFFFFSKCPERKEGSEGWRWTQTFFMIPAFRLLKVM